MSALSPPLSPRNQPLSIPSQSRRRPTFNTRQSSTTSPAAQLRLPSLPRFHPANFAYSQHSSWTTTAATSPNSPNPPLSPRSSSKRQYEIQRQMHQYQQQLLAVNTSQFRGSGGNPTSPRLAPLASPGAVTPLELEDDGVDYLVAGMNSREAGQHVEKLIRKEGKLRREYSPRRSSSMGTN